MNGNILLFIINIPIIQEVVRKYLIYSEMVFLAADIFVILVFIILSLNGRIRLKIVPITYWFLAAMFLAWTIVIQILKGRHLGIYGVGLRATFMPLVYMLVSAQYISTVKNAPDRIFMCVNIWILVAGVMAFLQISLGKYHPINAVWGQLAVGVGDYSTGEKGILIEGLFRPTSIFTHTGKFGQTLFTLVLFKWCYLVFCGKKKSFIYYALILFDLAAIFASGQRGAVIFLVVAVVIMFVVYSRQKGANISRFIGVVCIMVIGLSIFSIIKPGITEAIFDRFYSAVAAVPIRLQGNFVLPIKTMISEYLVMGEGFGFFTFGAQLFGGTLVYRYITMEGLGESSLIRLCGEVGVVPSLMLIMAYMTIVFTAYRKYKFNQLTPIGAICIFYVIWIVCLMLWSNTADIFANSVVTTLGYALSGAVFSHVWKSCIKK